MTLTNVVVGVLIALGLVGVVVPAMPGTLLVILAIAFWALRISSATGWSVLAVATGFVAAGTVLKYAVPGRRLKRDGIATSTLVIGGLLGFVGFFVVPVVGLPVGFVLGIYLAEWRRLGSRDLAGPSTIAALRAVGLSLLIELVAGAAAAGTWVVGLVLT